MVGTIAKYYSKLLLGDESAKIPHAFAYLCDVYKGVEFNPSRVDSSDL